MNQDNKASTKAPLYDAFIEAGFPVMIGTESCRRLNINDYLITNKTATYFLRVKGDSMIGAGIYPDDILIVDKSKEVSSGKIIIASLNGEFTVKRLIIKEGIFYLFSENKSFKPIKITAESNFEVFGVVTFNIHKPL